MIDLTDIVAERVTDINGQYFFGYYDISPESPDGSRILVNHPPFIDHMPSRTDALEVGYLDNGNAEFHKIAETYAWNFQEGCRLQWLSDDLIIFNDRDHADGKTFHSFVYSISKKNIIKEYDIPVYSVNIKKQEAITYSFFNNRYHYAHSLFEEATDFDRDGIFLLDLMTGKVKLLYSLKQLATLASSTGVKNWVEHCVFNRSGDRFFFFHRWATANGGFATRLYTGDLNGHLELLLDNAFCSHSGWRGNSQISAWGRLPSKINAVQNSRAIRDTLLYKIAVSVYHKVVKNNALRQKITNDSYVLFDLNSNTVEKIQNSDIIQDGHCTWDTSQRFMLTDTYADLDNMRNLLILDYKTNRLYRLGRFYTYPFRDKNLQKTWMEPGIQCDLHPKWGFSEKRVYFDSVYEGKRQLYRIDAERVLKRIAAGD